MKFFIKLMIFIVLLALLLPFTLLKGKDGKPLMSLSNLKAPHLAWPRMPDVLKRVHSPELMGGKDIIYQWKDAMGELHFSSTAPPADVKYTTKGYDPNTNLIQSVKIKAKKTGTVVAPSVKKPSDLPGVYSPGNIKKLKQDALRVQKLLNDRNKKLEAIIGNN